MLIHICHLRKNETEKEKENQKEREREGGGGGREEEEKEKEKNKEQESRRKSSNRRFIRMNKVRGRKCSCLRKAQRHYLMFM